MICNFKVKRQILFQQLHCKTLESMRIRSFFTLQKFFLLHIFTNNLYFFSVFFYFYFILFLFDNINISLCLIFLRFFLLFYLFLPSNAKCFFFAFYFYIYLLFSYLHVFVFDSFVYIFLCVISLHCASCLSIYNTITSKRLNKHLDNFFVV